MNEQMISVETPIKDLETALLTENNPENLNTIVDIFNLNIQKKNILRANKLSELQDAVCDQMQARLLHRSDEFSNKDLLEYFKTIQDTLDTQDTSINTSPLNIQINNQVNVKDDGLGRESKERVVDAIKSIFNKYSKEDSSVIDVEVIDDN